MQTAPLASAVLASTTDPVFAAIETHKAAWAEFCVVAQATANAKFMSKGEARRRTARDLYDTRTDALVRAPIATMGGLRAFTDYLAGLQAYGMPGHTGYAVECWHLSDAMEAVSDALVRLTDATASTPTAH